ncbi:MAG: glucosaminidase domain-containing protein [Deltaproteobacteria bacterium]|nr:glucosaminidase domain-containing protein [Deltaproteobacteria bacterium]
MPRGYTPEDKIEFIKVIHNHALSVSMESGFPLEFILAQAAYETGWGEHVIPGSNNLFNIKADPSWKGPKKMSTTTEYVGIGDDAAPIRVHDKFRAYGSYKESMYDWLDFLRSNPRYHGIGVKSNGERYIDIFDPVIKNDPEMLAYALWHDGFATNPRYAGDLIKMMKGPTLQKALKKINDDEPPSPKPSSRGSRSGAPARLSGHFQGSGHNGETLRRDDSDYKLVWRIEEDGATRGYFISE